MDAMSEAIEGADVMLYGVSLRYKESANCRLEANYAHQQELEYAHMHTIYTVQYVWREPPVQGVGERVCFIARHS